MSPSPPHGCRRSNPTGPGIRRVGQGAASYLDERGRPIVAETVLARIAALAIPPAWTDVWICGDERGHIQAVGVDQAGRRQYLYHSEWRRLRDKAKFARALVLAAALPAARRSVTRDLDMPGLSRRRALAAAFRMIDRGSLRIGSDEYLREHGSRGLTTLQCRSVRVTDDTVELVFPSKSGQEWRSRIRDDALARFLADAAVGRRSTARLLGWREGRRWRPLPAAEVNDDIRRRTRADLSAKDFRTLQGTLAAAQLLAEAPRATTQREADHLIAEAVRASAAVLGNTPAVARASYIDPRVIDRFRSGDLLRRDLSPESALRRLLAD